MKEKYYGKADLNDQNLWEISGAPDMLIHLKRIFPKGNGNRSGKFTISNTPENCRDLEWFSLRYPLKFNQKNLLRSGRRQYEKRAEALNNILNEKTFENFELALPPRDYQKQGATLFLANKALLLADEIGIGKTITALCALSKAEMRPAVVIAQAHLPQQWVDFGKKFLPQVGFEIAQTRKPHKLKDNTEILVISYSKINGWHHHLSQSPPKTLILDEVQELRRPESDKYKAIKSLRNFIPNCMGLSGSPIINYGGEIFHIMEIISPDYLGRPEEFKREWCSSTYNDQKWIIREPEVLGSYLRNNHLMLRRTRKDIGAQLPPLTTVVQNIPYKPEILAEVENTSIQLARIILEGSFTEKGQASRELDLKLRQATGIAKSYFCAEFTRLLLQEGTPTIVFAWHRTVYQIFQDLLKEHNPILYTGSEQPSEKEKNKERFISGESNLMLLSLRSGAGLDGLQHRCSTAVFAELDWSGEIMKQCIGRILRDGQLSPVNIFYLLAQGGSDPIISQILGLKSQQAQGIVELFEKKDKNSPEPIESRMKLLAQEFLKTHHQKNDS